MARISSRWCVLSVASHQRHIVLICPNVEPTTFDYLVKVVSTRCLQCKYTFLILKCLSQFGTLKLCEYFFRDIYGLRKILTLSLFENNRKCFESSASIKSVKRSNEDFILKSQERGENNIVELAKANFDGKVKLWKLIILLLLSILKRCWHWIFWNHRQVCRTILLYILL